MERYHAERSAAAPLPSAGGVFRSPPAIPPGAHRGCGGKGLSIGAARVSEKHANLLSTREAPQPVILAIELIRQRVKDKFGVGRDRGPDRRRREINKREWSCVSKYIVQGSLLLGKIKV